jgi:hypothetical protein
MFTPIVAEVIFFSASLAVDLLAILKHTGGVWEAEKRLTIRAQR